MRAIAEKLGIPAFAAYLQHVHTTAVYPSGMLPPVPLLGGAYNFAVYAPAGIAAETVRAHLRDVRGYVLLAAPGVQVQALEVIPEKRHHDRRHLWQPP